MTKTASIYGGALYDLAQTEHLDFLPELSQLADLFHEHPQYLSLLAEPSIPRKTRLQLLDESLRDQVHRYLLNFLKILCENREISLFFDCVQQYQKRYNNDHGIVPVTARTAVPLSPILSQKLRDKLEAVTGKTVQLTSVVDPGVLGGVCLSFENRQLDGTVKHRLDEIKRDLLQLLL